MIRINLLPVEKRKRERTPLPRFGLILLDAGVLTAVVFLCLLHLIWINDLQTEIKNLQTRRDSLAGAVKDHKDLTGEIAKLTATLKDIENTTGRKVEWWRAMDALWEVIHFNPRIWITDLQTIDDKAAASAAKSYNSEFAGTPGYGVTMKCHCAGKDVTSLTKFRMDLKRNADVKKYFSEINWDAQWNVTREEAFVEGWSMSFDIKLIGRFEPPGAKPAPRGGPAR